MGNGRQAIKLTSLILWLAAGSSAFAGECKEDEILLRGDWGQARFTVEVADTDAERAQGLMNRDSLPKSAGMLFVYTKPGPVGFWMKDTLIPLDMMFIDSTGTVRHVHHEARPLDESPVFGGNDIQYVLEINGGLARQFGIEEGSHVRHPAVDSTLAAWPC